MLLRPTAKQPESFMSKDVNEYLQSEFKLIRGEFFCMSCGLNFSSPARHPYCGNPENLEDEDL